MKDAFWGFDFKMLPNCILVMVKMQIDTKGTMQGAYIAVKFVIMDICDIMKTHNLHSFVGMADLSYISQRERAAGSKYDLRIIWEKKIEKQTEWLEQERLRLSKSALSRCVVCYFANKL